MRRSQSHLVGHMVCWLAVGHSDWRTPASETTGDAGYPHMDLHGLELQHMQTNPWRFSGSMALPAQLTVRARHQQQKRRSSNAPWA
eukprot:scaffold110361_cov15-Tisochrysis_lutea.AAC.3